MLVALRGEALRAGDACTLGTDTRSSGAAGAPSSALAAAAAGAGANGKGAAGFRSAAITPCSHFAVSLQPPIAGRTAVMTEQPSTVGALTLRWKYRSN